MTHLHADIKPSNILLCRNGQVKLCDFGVSGEFGTKGDANTFIGTSYYMAPERITGQSYTITSDVWSLGVTLLEVAQHRFPFPADGTEMQPRAGLIDLLTYIVRQPIPKLKDEPENRIRWSDNFKYFIECWYVVRVMFPEFIANLFPVLKKSLHGEQLLGGCWNIPGSWTWEARKSTWPTSWNRCGTGKSRCFIYLIQSQHYSIDFYFFAPAPDLPLPTDGAFSFFLLIYHCICHGLSFDSDLDGYLTTSGRSSVWLTRLSTPIYESWSWRLHSFYIHIISQRLCLSFLAGTVLGISLFIFMSLLDYLVYMVHLLLLSRVSCNRFLSLEKKKKKKKEMVSGQQCWCYWMHLLSVIFLFGWCLHFEVFFSWYCFLFIYRGAHIHTYTCLDKLSLSSLDLYLAGFLA